MIISQKIVRAIHIAKVGRFNLCVLFNDETDFDEVNNLLNEVGRHFTLAPIHLADMVVQYDPNDEKASDEYWDEVKKATFKPIPRPNFLALEQGSDALIQNAVSNHNLTIEDVDIVKKFAQVIAQIIDENRYIRLRQLNEALSYRIFDRSLLVDDRVWTAEQLGKILVEMEWKEEYLENHINIPVGFDIEDLSYERQCEAEGMMWGWQDAVNLLREKMGLVMYLGDHKKSQPTVNSPSKSACYICKVNGERMPLMYNVEQNIWFGFDGQTYKPSQVTWHNDNF